MGSPYWIALPLLCSIFEWLNKGVCHHTVALPFWIKKYFKAKEEL